MKVSITYNRKVTTPIQYESLTIGASQDFDSEYRTMDDVFDDVKKWVDDKIAQTLHEMEQAITNG